MHDELRRFGLRRVWMWSIVLVIVGAVAGAGLTGLAAADPVWPVTMEFVAGGLRTLAAGALLGAIGTVLLLLFAERRVALRAWPTTPLAPAPDLVPLAEGLALARGEVVPRVWRLESSAPNVACLSRPHGRHLVVSSAAEDGLTRDELEALMALQFSLLLDPGAARVRRTLVGTGRMMTWTALLTLAATVVSTVRHVVWSGLTINIGLWFGVLVVVLIVVVQRRLRWAWGLVGDAVALETTRQPAALVSALRRVASYNGDQVPVLGLMGANDPFWAVPVRRKVEVATMVVNDQARSRTSTEQVSDVALLLRARIVEQARLGGEPATLASWREAATTFDRLGRYGATLDGDGTVDGVTVTTEGATLGALGPVAGSWAEPSSRWYTRRSRHPWHPDAAALAAYDQAVPRTSPSA
jgi:Zn-dependent protease with chaperone function